MKNEVQLTDILKAAIQSLNKNLNEIQDPKFRFWGIHTKDKVESGIVSVDELVVTSSYETTKRT